MKICLIKRGTEMQVSVDDGKELVNMNKNKNNTTALLYVHVDYDNC